MKKAYTITPAKYFDNLKYIRSVEYRYGEDTSDYPKTTLKKYEKAVKENASVEKPKASLFFKNEVMYNLWLNRETEEPVTAKELFTIVSTLNEYFKDKISSASCDWSSENTIM